MNNILLFV